MKCNRHIQKQARDAAQVFELKVKTMAAKPDRRIVIEYVNQSKSLWQELVHYRVIKTKCLVYVVVLKDFIKQDKSYDFLAWFNPEFDQMRIHIVGK